MASRNTMQRTHVFAAAPLPLLHAAVPATLRLALPCGPPLPPLKRSPHRHAPYQAQGGPAYGERVLL